MDAIRKFLIDTLGPLSASQVSIFFLGAIAIGLVLALYFMPTFEEMVSRSNFGADRTRFSSRMIRQMQSLKPTRDNKMADMMRAGLYRGGRSTDIMDTSGDFFVFLRLLCATGVGGAACLYVLLLHQSPLFLVLALMGFFLPQMFATLHNNGRRRKIMAALPLALPRLASAIDTEEDLRAAIGKVAKSNPEGGPLYDELNWAAGRMAAAVSDRWEILRQLDTRNGIVFFRPLADAAERESALQDSRMRKVVREHINEFLKDFYLDMEKRLLNLPNKVIMQVALPMLIGVLSVIMGPVILSLLDQLGKSSL